MRIWSKIITLLLLNCFTETKTLGVLKDRSFGIGNQQTFLGLYDRVTTQDSGKSDFLGTHHLWTLRSSYTKSLPAGFFWQPSVTLSILPRKSENGKIEESLLFLNSSFGKNLPQKLDAYGGIGLLRSQIQSNGGSFTDPNNNTFSYPSGSKSSQVFYLNGGVGYSYQDWRIASELLCLACFHHQKRTFGISFLFTYEGWSL